MERAGRLERSFGAELKVTEAVRLKLGRILANQAAREAFSQVTHIRMKDGDPRKFVIFVPKGTVLNETEIGEFTFRKALSDSVTQDIYDLTLKEDVFGEARLCDLEETATPTSLAGRTVVEDAEKTEQLAIDLVNALLQIRARLEEAKNRRHNLLQQVMKPVVRELIAAVQADPAMELNITRHRAEPGLIETVIVLDIPFEDLPLSLKGRTNIMLPNGAHMRIHPCTADEGCCSVMVDNIPEEVLLNATLDLSEPQSPRWTGTQSDSWDVREVLRQWLS